MLKLQNFIGGQYVECEKFLDSYDPSKGEVWAKIPNSGPQDVDSAVKAAREAFPA